MSVVSVVRAVDAKDEGTLFLEELSQDSRMCSWFVKLAQESKLRPRLPRRKLIEKDLSENGAATARGGTD